MVLLNYWATLESPVVSWVARFPLENPQDIDRLLGFVTGMLQAGQREDAYRLLEEPGSPPFRAAEGSSYADHLRRVMDRTGSLPLFSGAIDAAPTRGGRLRAPSYVSYYDAHGTVVQEHVEDLGSLLRGLRPDRDPLRIPQQPPVSIRSWNVNIRGLSRGETRPGPVEIEVLLYTDIWFPEVLGFLEDDNHSVAGEKMYDNRELAVGHTPRLSRFVAAVHVLALEWGGEWYLDEPEIHVPAYIERTGVDGINLDD